MVAFSRSHWRLGGGGGSSGGQIEPHRLNVDVAAAVDLDVDEHRFR